MFRTIVVGILATLTQFDIAFASGEVYARIADKSSVASCDEGQLYEQLHDSGNVSSFGAKYILACMKDAKSAHWIMIAGSGCSDPTGDSKKCSSRKARSIPPFIADRNFWQKAKPPIEFRYNAVKYGMGRDCKEIEQKRSSLPNADDVSHVFWFCENIQTFDETADTVDGGYFQDPKKFNLYRITTTSKRPFTTYAEPVVMFGEEFVPADTFSIPEYEYVYSYEP